MPPPPCTDSSFWSVHLVNFQNLWPCRSTHLIIIVRISFKVVKLRGWIDSSGGEMLPTQAWEPEFNPSVHTWKANAGSYCCCVLNFVWVFCLHARLCITCTLGGHRGQKKVSNPLEGEIQLLVSYNIGAGNWTLTFWKRGDSAFNCWAISSLPNFDFYFQEDGDR